MIVPSQKLQQFCYLENIYILRSFQTRTTVCLLNGLCLTSSILYQTTIKCTNSKYKQKRYKGICETTFKKRYAKHKKS